MIRVVKYSNPGGCLAPKMPLANGFERRLWFLIIRATDPKPDSVSWFEEIGRGKDF